MKNKVTLRVGRAVYELERLCFLADFLNLMEIQTLLEVSSKIGISNQALSYNFKRDDMDVSFIYKILDEFGYKIRFEYINNEEDNTVIDEKSKTITKVVGNIEMKLNNVKFINSRLFCIHYAMAKYGLSKANIYNKIGVCRQVFNRRIDIDDCPMSMLTSIAENYGWRLKVDITKKEEKTE